MKTPRPLTILLAVSLGIYVLATALGVLMRFAFVTPMPWLPFAHAIHAHSHTLYFGWVGLSVLALAFRLVGDEGRFVQGLLGTVAVLSLATFVSFLEGGYSTASIVFSTAFLFVWSAAVIRWWRAARGRVGLPYTYLRAGMLYLVIASLGAWARVVLIAMKVESPLPGKLAVFAFLHNFGWFFVFAVTGLLVANAKALGLRFDERLLRTHLGWAAPVAWLAFPLGVAGGATVEVLGPIARVAGFALLVPGAMLTWVLIKAARDAAGPMRSAMAWLAIWYGLKTAMEAGGALGLSDVSVAARHPAILYLHVFLLGFVTLALMLPVLHHLKRPLGWALHGHNVGLAVLAAGLAMLSGPAFGMLWLVPWVPTGFLVAALGGALTFAAGCHWAMPRWRPKIAPGSERDSGGGRPETLPGGLQTGFPCR